MPTFEEAVDKVIAIHSDAWKDGGKTAKLWRATLREYAYPHIGEKGIDKVTTADVMVVLLPIWTRKHETARKLRRRIGTAMKWAIAQGYRGDNPAGEAIAAALPKRSAPVRHMRALPHSEVADALAAVRASRAWAATKLAFELLVLTATRSGGVRLATWDEFDLPAFVWTIPAESKAQREHRVPLRGRAIEILHEARSLGKGTGLVFPSIRGKALSDMTLSKLVREQGIAAVPHGFRSSFRDWAAERTNYPREVIEAALAHVVSNQTEAAYARSDLFERRRRLMDDWAAYLAGRARASDSDAQVTRRPRSASTSTNGVHGSQRAQVEAMLDACVLEDVPNGRAKQLLQRVVVLVTREQEMGRKHVTAQPPAFGLRGETDPGNPVRVEVGCARSR